MVISVGTSTVRHTTQAQLNEGLSDSVLFLEKAAVGRASIADITDALKEYKTNFKVGLASPAEILTLSRAFPDDAKYSKAVAGIEKPPVVVGGPASVEMVDREGHLITTGALTKSFDRYMANKRTRNVMVMHSDVQVGWALPAYITKGGSVFKSGVDPKGLFFITEMRNDTKIAGKVTEQIENGKMRSYSIAGNATVTKDIQKADGTKVMQVDDLELAEVTICEKGVNQGAHFDLMKGMIVTNEQLLARSEPNTSYYITKEAMPSFLTMFRAYMNKEGKEKEFDIDREDQRRAQLKDILEEFGIPEEPEDKKTPVSYKVDGTSARVVNQSGQDTELRKAIAKLRKADSAQDIGRGVIDAFSSRDKSKGSGTDPVPVDDNIDSFEGKTPVAGDKPKASPMDNAILSKLQKLAKSDEEVSVDGKDAILLMPPNLATQRIMGRPAPAATDATDRLRGAILVLKSNKTV